MFRLFDIIWFLWKMTGKNKKTQDEIIHEIRTRVKLEEYGVENVSYWVFLVLYQSI